MFRTGSMSQTTPNGGTEILLTDLQVRTADFLLTIMTVYGSITTAGVPTEAETDVLTATPMG